MMWTKKNNFLIFQYTYPEEKNQSNKDFEVITHILTTPYYHCDDK